MQCLYVSGTLSICQMMESSCQQACTFNLQAVFLMFCFVSLLVSLLFICVLFYLCAFLFVFICVLREGSRKF